MARAASTWTTISSTGSPLAIDIDDSNNVWIGDADGGWDGVIVVPSATGTIFGQNVQQGVETPLFTLTGVQGILMDPAGRLFVATSAGELWVVTSSNSTVFGVQTTANVLTLIDGSGLFMGGLAMDSAGNLFGGRMWFDGVAVLPVGNGTLYGVTVSGNTPAVLSPVPPWTGDVAIDSNDNLIIGSWFGGSEGVFVLPKVSGTMYGQPVIQDTLHQLVSTNFVAGVDVDQDDNIYYAIWSQSQIYVLTGVNITLFGQAFAANTADVLSGVPAGNADQGLAVSANGSTLVSGGASTTQLAWTPDPSPSPPLTPTIIPVWRLTLDPNGGTCTDGTARTETWTTAFVGYRYLPGASDCTRPGHTFTGWANTTTPTIPLDLPLLDDPSDGTRRYFIASNTNLIAIWTKNPEPITNLTVFANFFCGPCTTIWLIHPTTPANTTVDITIDNKSATCTIKADAFGLAFCQITPLTLGNHTITLTPRNGTVTGPPTNTSITLRS
jgi:hypothetical protein